MADYEQLPLQLEPAADAPAIVGQLILRLLLRLSPLQHTVHKRTSTAKIKNGKLSSKATSSKMPTGL